MSETPPAPTTSSADVLRTLRVDLLKAVFDDARDLVPNYIRGYSVYVIITGALLKFAFDANATTKLREMLAWFGIFISLLGILVCALGELTYRSLRRDAHALADELGVTIAPSFALPIRYLVLISLVFVIGIVSGWIYVLARF